MPSLCLSIGCRNRISEVDLQLGHRQCHTCRLTKQPPENIMPRSNCEICGDRLSDDEIASYKKRHAQCAGEPAPKRPPRPPKSRETTIAPQKPRERPPAYTPTAIDAEAGDAFAAGKAAGVAQERERILGGLRAEAMERWWSKEDTLADQLRALVGRLEAMDER